MRYILQRLPLKSYARHDPQHLPHLMHLPPLFTLHSCTCLFFRYQTILLRIHPSSIKRPANTPILSAECNAFLKARQSAWHAKTAEMIKKIAARTFRPLIIAESLCNPCYHTQAHAKLILKRIPRFMPCSYLSSYPGSCSSRTQAHSQAHT